MEKINIDYDRLEKMINNARDNEYMKIVIPAVEAPKTKAETKAEFAEKQKNPTTRKSIFANVYEDSVEGDWENYPEVGWVHKTEKISFSRYYAQCCVTKKWCNIESMVKSYNGNGEAMRVSNVAIKKGGFKQCALTGYWSRIEDGVTARDSNDSDVFVSNYALNQNGPLPICDHNKHTYIPSAVIRVRDSVKYRHVCASVANRGDIVRECRSCNRWFESEIVTYRRELHDEYYCNPCYVRAIRRNIILAHNAKDYPSAIHSEKYRLGARIDEKGVVHATNKKEKITEPRLFGVEAETEMNVAGVKKANLDRVSMALAVHEALGNDFVITKEDGTLTTNGKYSDSSGNGPLYAGFEIVTAPADLEVHRERWSRLPKMEGYKHFRAWDTETCGFHVHVSRAALTSLQIARILVFINNKKNQKFIQKVAGRGQHEFCRYVPKEPKDALRVDPRTDQNRRQAVNLCNANTIEFRIFRGTINPRHILRNIEFCDAVCDYCYPCARSIKELLDSKGFIEFVSNNRKRWPLLASWFAFHKMIDSKKLGDKADKSKLTLSLEVEEPEIKSEMPKPEPIKVFAFAVLEDDGGGEEVPH